MKISVPFFKNDEGGNQCMQVAMKSVLKHFLNQDFTLEELDHLTGRKKGLWTWTSQAVGTLHDLGLELKYYSRTDLKPFLAGEPFIRSHYGQDAQKILRHTDLSVVLKKIRQLLKYDIFTRQKLSLAELENHLQQKHLPLVLIDNNKITGRADTYQGHFILLTGFDDQYFFYHDSGPTNPKANKKVSKSKFRNAWNANGTDNDVIIICGKKTD